MGELKKMSIYAGIVTYNSEIGRLCDNIASIALQVEKVIIFDNGSINQSKLELIIKEYNNVFLIKSNENRGIAYALNRLMEYGLKNHMEWMLTLDQDSICPSNYVDVMKEYLYIKPCIGIVAPVIIDNNIGEVGHLMKKEYMFVKTCISSGAIISIDAWNKIGRYDESMFIDSVDFEFCYRMNKEGYKVIQTKKMYLYHEIGNARRKKFLLWNITVFGHSATRKYYIARNTIYYPLKHRLIVHLIRGNLRNMWLIVKIIIYEDNKKKKVKKVLEGWSDGYFKR